MTVTIFVGSPYCWRIFHSAGRWILSNALRKLLLNVNMNLYVIYRTTWSPMTLTLIDLEWHSSHCSPVQKPRYCGDDIPSHSGGSCIVLFVSNRRSKLPSYFKNCTPFPGTATSDLAQKVTGACERSGAERKTERSWLNVGWNRACRAVMLSGGHKNPILRGAAKTSTPLCSHAQRLTTVDCSSGW